MTKAQKLLNKFPKMEHNENVLTDVACPKCGGRVEFKIVVTTTMAFTDEGSGDEAPHCETCGKAYPEGGDGWAGECPACADKTAAADEADQVDKQCLITPANRLKPTE